MPNCIVEFKVGDTLVCESTLLIPPRIGEKIRYIDGNGKEVILKIEDIIYEFVPGKHKSMTVTAQCKLF